MALEPRKVIPMVRNISAEWRLLARAGAAVLALAAPTTALAQAEGTTLELDTPIGLVASSCSGDMVTTTGTIHTKVSTLVSSSGNIHITATARYDAVTGTSITGKRFVSDTTSLAELTLAKGSESTIVLSGRFVVSGESGGVNPLDPGDDFFVHQTVHFTFSAAGALTAAVTKIEAGCR